MQISRIIFLWSCYLNRDQTLKMQYIFALVCKICQNNMAHFAFENVCHWRLVKNCFHDTLKKAKLNQHNDNSSVREILHSLEPYKVFQFFPRCDFGQP